MARFRLLSIDGGGIRGLLPALVLAEVERRTGRPIAHLFDAVAGTSAGGILALALTLGKGGQPRFGAGELAALFRQRGAEIFTKDEPWRTIDQVADRIPGLPGLEAALGLPPNADLHDLVRPKYPPDGRRRVLHDYLGEARLADALTRVFVTSYDTDGRVPVFFDSGGEDDEVFFDRVRDAAALDAAMATSAAPTYFPPHPLRTSRDLCLVDGGVFANNPVALAHAFTRPAGADDAVVISVGCGSMTDSYRYQQLRTWGAVRWVEPVLRTMMDGQAEAAALLMRRGFPPGRFFRWQPLLSETGVPEDLDDTRPDTLARIAALADRLVTSRSAEIDAACALLT